MIFKLYFLNSCKNITEHHGDIIVCLIFALFWIAVKTDNWFQFSECIFILFYMLYSWHKPFVWEFIHVMNKINQIQPVKNIKCTKYPLFLCKWIQIQMFLLQVCERPWLENALKAILKFIKDGLEITQAIFPIH